MQDLQSVINIADLLRSDSWSELFDRIVDLSEIDNHFTDIHFMGNFKNIAGVLTVKAEIHGVYHGECDRCLKPVSVNLTAKISTILSMDGAKDDSVTVSNGKIDLVKTAYDALSLELPTVLLCKEDCKGLCPVCGSNLNDGPCKCDC